MIAYLCALWNEDDREPLRSFLGYFNMPLRECDRFLAVLEWNKIDLVIFASEDRTTPLLAIEMKVDGYDSLTTKKIQGETKKDYQTVVYSELLPASCPLLYITIGAGEYFRTPYSEKAQWVRIRELHKAIEAISTDDSLIKEWRSAIANEIDLQDRCFSRDRSRLDDFHYRGRTWNLYFLGHLKEKLMESLSSRDITIDPAVYTAGRGPDTILNFGCSKLPAYVEINDNGRLNLKISFEEIMNDEKEDCLRKAQAHYYSLLENFNPKVSPRKLDHRHNTVTALSFDVGLDNKGGNLTYESPQADTIRKLAEVLEAFHNCPAPE